MNEFHKEIRGGKGMKERYTVYCMRPKRIKVKEKPKAKERKSKRQRNSL